MKIFQNNIMITYQQTKQIISQTTKTQYNKMKITCRQYQKQK